MRLINKAGRDLIKSFEGIEDGNPATANLDPYLDPVGIWTIGWGHAITYGKEFLRGKENKEIAFSLYPGGITYIEAEGLLSYDCGSASRAVESLVKVALTDEEFSALTSFCFNIGAGNFASSTMRKKLNAGDYHGAADQFGRWVWGTNDQGIKVKLPGLVSRREREKELFLS